MTGGPGCARRTSDSEHRRAAAKYVYDSDAVRDDEDNDMPS